MIGSVCRTQTTQKIRGEEAIFFLLTNYSQSYTKKLRKEDGVDYLVRGWSCRVYVDEVLQCSIFFLFVKKSIKQIFRFFERVKELKENNYFQEER